MCGIIGYTGPRQVLDILVDGLATLEYRGYDSAGVAVVDAGSGAIRVEKRAGKLGRLRERLDGIPMPGTAGLGHTRWATHGEPNDVNAHPHIDSSGNLALIHNGIFENYAELKADLVKIGHKFASATDTEVVAHLIGAEFDRCGDLVQAVRTALQQVHGQFAIAVVDRRDPSTIVASRRDAP